jgi:hypothetical protein
VIQVQRKHPTFPLTAASQQQLFEVNDRTLLHDDGVDGILPLRICLIAMPMATFSYFLEAISQQTA